MEYIRHKTDSKTLGGNKLRLHPICCWHIGATQCDLKFIEEAIKEIKNDPAARWFYMGDGGECVTKLSKGNIFEQTLSPQQQLDYLVELLEPIREKGIGGVRGNHGNRIDKETGLSFDKSLMNQLGVPYLGVSAMVNLAINRSSYDVWFHHGAPSGASLQSKVNAAKKAYHIMADVRVTGHSHVCMELDPEFYTYAINEQRRVNIRPVHQLIAGCAYNSWVEGYAEEKLYSPVLPGRAVIELDGGIREGRPNHQVGVQITRSMGEYDSASYTQRQIHKWLERSVHNPY